MIELSFGTWQFSIRRVTANRIDIEQMYDKAAALWHRTIFLLGFISAYENLFSILKKDGWLESKENKIKILDAGIGTGALSLGLLKVCRAQVEIHGIDISNKMLSEAASILNSVNSENKLISASVESLPYQNSEFDFVMNAHLLEHCEHLEEIIQKLSRVLKLGSSFLIVTTRKNRMSAIHSLRWRYRTIEEKNIEAWMENAGIALIKKYQFKSRFIIPDYFSIAYIGRKIR